MPSVFLNNFNHAGRLLCYAYPKHVLHYIHKDTIDYI